VLQKLKNFQNVNYIYNKCTHARTHARPHARTHARTHAQDPNLINALEFSPEPCEISKLCFYDVESRRTYFNKKMLILYRDMKVKLRSTLFFLLAI